MLRNFFFCRYFQNLDSFENFKYYQFIWSKILTHDNNFIFYLQCHTLASLFLNMPICIRPTYIVKMGFTGVYTIFFLFLI